MKFTSFEELKKNIITPEQKEDDFIRLCLTSEIEPASRKLIFTQNFDYNLNPNNKIKPYNINHEYAKTKAEILLNNILKMSNEEKQNSEHRDILNDYTFIYFLRKLSSCSLEEYTDFISIKHGNTINPELKKHIDNFETIAGYKNHDFHIYTGDWYYFVSEKTHTNRQRILRSNTINHRLYIAINYDQLVNFSRDFILKLEEKNLPYNFKIKNCLQSGKAIENDTIVIYADTEEQLTEYVNILNEIIERNPQYSESIHTPSAHLGSIGDKIGYGREFADHSTSYSSVIGRAGSHAIHATLNIYKDHRLIPMKQKDAKQYILEIMNCKNNLFHMDEYKNFKKCFWEHFYESLSKETADENIDSMIFNS